uniref:Cation-transporting P-type ATPase C-terminal domain-containing protein n=1 Tax=Romanomermis culicivorax TaxID=13658 RepID=A0A915IEZ6_ROMCU
SNRESLDYGHFAKKVFDHGPSDRLRRKSKTIMYIANAANIFYQIGVCAIQIVFMATNLQQVRIL